MRCRETNPRAVRPPPRANPLPLPSPPPPPPSPSPPPPPPPPPPPSLPLLLLLPSPPSPPLLSSSPSPSSSLPLPLPSPSSLPLLPPPPLRSLDVRLYYERAGNGDPELLFVPGWCCDHTAFRPQFEHFAETTRSRPRPARVRAERRPRRGLHDPRARRRPGSFCCLVRDREAGRRRPQPRRDDRGRARRRVSVLPSALVLVDPGPIDPLPETVEFFRGSRSSSRPGGEEVRREYVHDMGARTKSSRAGSSTTCAPSRCRRGGGDPRRQRVERRGTLSVAATVPSCCSARNSGRVPTCFGCARSTRSRVGITVGAGHFHQLEVPEQVNAMIERFLAISL